MKSGWLHGGDAAGKDDLFGAHALRRLEHVGRPPHIGAPVLLAPVGPEVVERGEVDHYVNPAMLASDTLKGRGDCPLLSDVEPLPAHFRSRSEERHAWFADVDGGEPVFL
jgi:hypothetical protein